MAGGEGCLDERRGSSASEVGTVDGTAKKKIQKKIPSISKQQLCFVVSKASRTVLTFLCIPGDGAVVH